MIGGQWVLHVLLLGMYILQVTSSTDNKTNVPSGLIWTDLSVQSDDGKFLLHNCHGFVPDGHLCALLGPSGAGKSTTLSALGGSISSASGLQINGDVLYYNADRETVEHLHLESGKVAWLEQKDQFFSMLTVQETLELAAFLALPRFSRRQRIRRVHGTMDSLGLAKLKDRRIGDSAVHRGLSGGEKRRLSLALELLSAPKLFIGDEPTSGLDSTLSEKVVRLIKKLVTERQIPCVLSLHQPRSSVWRMLDSVILLAPGGRVCYMGPTETATSYFSKLGYECPSQTNPAEFLLDLVSVDSEDARKAGEDEDRITKLAAAFVDSRESSRTDVYPAHALNVDELQVVSARTKRSFDLVRRLRRFGYLVKRSWLQNIRNHKVNALRVLVSGGNAYLFANVFKSVRKGAFTAKSVADRTALLTFGVVNMSLMALMKTIDLFAKEKPVVLREQQRHQYTSSEYLLSKSLAEIPLDTVFAAIFTTVLKSVSGIRIGWRVLTATFSLMTVAGASLGFAIGSLSPSAEVAMSAGTPIMVLLMSVGIINPSGVDPEHPPPAVVEALRQLSPIAFAIKAVCIAEYRGMEFESSKKRKNILQFGISGISALKDLPKMGALALVRNGDQVLQELGLGDETYGGSMRHLAFLSAANLVISWVGLKMQGSNSSPSK